MLEDVTKAAKKVKKNPAVASRDHLPPQARKALDRKKEEGIKGPIPPDIFEEVKQGNTKRFYKWLDENKKPKGEQKQGQQRQQQGQQKQQPEKKKSTPRKPKRVKDVFSPMSVDLIKNLTGRKQPKKKADELKDKNEKKGQQKKGKQKKGRGRQHKKNPPFPEMYLPKDSMFGVKSNPVELDEDGELYLEDFGETMTPSEAKRKFKSEKLRGPVGSDKLFMQLAEKVQDFGEASGWIKGDKLYYRPGAKHLNEAMVTGYIMEGADAFFHTHPRVWEPSQTSPDDFKVYHGLFTINGIQDHFTVMGDRIDWFHFAKSNRIKADEMAEVIMDFEDEIEEVFMDAESDHVHETDGNASLRDRTKAIVEALNTQIPEYQVRFKCYQMSPEQIRDSKT